MPLEFYDIGDRSFSEQLFQLCDADLKAIESVLHQYRKLTGLHIDQYGTIKVSQGHVELIIKLLNGLLTNDPSKKSVESEIRTIRDNFEKATNGLIAVGD